MFQSVVWIEGYDHRVKLSNGQHSAFIFPGQRVSGLLFRLVEPHTESTNQPLTVFLPLSSVQITCQRFPPRDSTAPIPKLTDRKLIMPFLTFSACVRLCRSMCERIVVFFFFFPHRWPLCLLSFFFSPQPGKSDSLQ